jgi:hypothetical protein
VQPLGSFQHFMEPEGSLPSSQELFTCTYPEPDQSGSNHYHMYYNFLLSMFFIFYAAHTESGECELFVPELIVKNISSYVKICFCLEIICNTS